MNVKGKIETLKSLIENEKGFIKWSILLAITPILIGLTSTIVLLFWGNEVSAEASELTASNSWLSFGKIIKTAPGLLGAAIGAFPFKDYFTRKNRIVAYTFLKIQYNQIEKEENPPDPEIVKDLDTRFKVLLDKFLA